MKILVLGANGMIGHRILLKLRENKSFEVYGQLRRAAHEFSNIEFFKKNIFDRIDLSIWKNLENLLEDLKPDIIINAVGITIRRSEVEDLNNALEINSFLPQRIAKWVQKNNKKLIHLSTDCVFSGDAGSYTELSNPTSKDNYGRSKFLGEVDGANCLTLRFSCIGRELDVKSELLEWFLAQKEKVISGHAKAMYSGVTSITIANEVAKIVLHHPKLEGLFQISGPPISKYDLLCLANEVFNNKTMINKSENYISDKTLISDKYQSATGYKMKSWIEMMNELANDQLIKY